MNRQQKKQRYQELEDRLYSFINTGEPVISPEEDKERLALFFALNREARNEKKAWAKLPDIQIASSSSFGRTLRKKPKKKGWSLLKWRRKA